MKVLALRRLALHTCLVAASICPQYSIADILTITVTSPNVTGMAGQTVDFTGVITNRTGVALTSTDLFLDFIGYDYAVLNPNQILGSSPFTLPNLTFSPKVDLFSVDIDPAALDGIYTLEVFLQDIQGDLSATKDIVIQVNSGVNRVPEPTTLPLVLLAGALVWALRRRCAETGQHLPLAKSVH